MDQRSVSLLKFQWRKSAETVVIVYNHDTVTLRSLCTNCPPGMGSRLFPGMRPKQKRGEVG